MPSSRAIPASCRACSRRSATAIPPKTSTSLRSSAGELAEHAEIAALERLGFTDVTAARAELARARRRPGSPLSPAATGRAARVGAHLLAEIAASADPDQALRSLGDLIASRGEAWSIWQLLDEQPAITRLLGSLLGRERVSRDARSPSDPS